MDRNGAARSWTTVGRGRGWATQSTRAHSQAPGLIQIMDAAGRVLETIDPKTLPLAGGFHEEADARARKRAQQARRGGRRAHPQSARDTTQEPATVSPAELGDPAWPEVEEAVEPRPEDPNEDHVG